MGRALSSTNEETAFSAARYYIDRQGKAFGWSVHEPPDPFEEFDLKKLTDDEFYQCQAALEKAHVRFGRLPKNHDLRRKTLARPKKS